MLDVNAIRNDFPFIKNNPEVIYFDSAATSLKPQSVIDAVNDFYTKYTANIHRGDYDVSFKTSKAYDETRKIVKDFINAESFQEIVFTSGDTFSLNQIIFGYVKTHIKEDEYILTTKLEHASSILPVYECHKQFLFADVNSDGTINLSKFEELFKTNNKIKYVLITYVSNVLGYINPIKELCTLAHQHGVKVIVDGAQALPHFKVDVKDLDVDFLTFSGHKMLSGSGIGILYGKKELLEEMTPLLYGGGANARFDDKGNIILKNVPERFEAGTPNIEGVISLGAAIKYLDSIGMNNIHEYDASLVDYAMRKLSSLDNLIIYNPLSRSSLITFNVKGIFAQDVASYLNYHHICVRTGNHCAKILHNIIGEDQTIRLSLYFYNTKEEIDKIYEVLKDITIEKCIGVVI